MQTKYVDHVQTEKKFVGNIVMLIDGQYYAMYQPDSGLSIPSPFDKCIESLILNPTTVDLRRVTSTVSSSSFKLVDRELAISALVKGDAAAFIGQEVTIWIGRVFVNMPFSNYYQLPKVQIKKASRSGNAYTFSATEDSDRMAKSIYTQSANLQAAALVETTTLVLEQDLSEFPSSGLLKIDDEFMSYSGVDLALRRFTGVIRGEENSVPAEHKLGALVSLAEVVTGHPIDILLKILTSGGGGGAYDVLQDGLGISESLIDIAEIESIRDELFGSDTFQNFSGIIYNQDSALKLIEREILAPLNLRFSYSNISKLTLAVIDKAVFVDETGSINEDSISKEPTWEVDGNSITNVIRVSWDYFEPEKRFLRTKTFKDQDSIDQFGEQPSLNFDFKWIHDDTDGEELVLEFANSLLARISRPIPVVSVTTHLDKSLKNIGDKVYVESKRIPAESGDLNFASEMEIVSRAINQQVGDVLLKLAFTSFTGIRSGYVSPSDLIVDVLSQKKVELPAGRGSYYRPGWKMRLWDDATNSYFSDSPNEIQSIDGDLITFVDNWITTLANGYRIRFADYDDVSNSQKRYAFVSDGETNFDDNGKPYRVTY